MIIQGKRSVDLILYLALVTHAVAITFLCGTQAFARPYDFILPDGIARWGELSPQERLAWCTVPDSVLSNMSTDDLVATCLGYPFRKNYVAFSSVTTGLEAVVRGANCFQELEVRSDAPRAIIAYLADLDARTDWHAEPSKEAAGNDLDASLLELLLARQSVMSSATAEQRDWMIAHYIESDRRLVRRLIVGRASIALLGGTAIFEQSKKFGAQAVGVSDAAAAFLENGMSFSDDVDREIFELANDYIAKAQQRGK